MKKIFCILSILSIVSPVFADPTPVAGDPGASVAIATAPKATNNPGYGLANSATTDTNAASAGYVKGAYNATIKAVNTVASVKQDTLSSANGGNVTTSGSGSVVTGLTASAGTVTVAMGEVTIPVGSTASPTSHASIWIQ